jgi:hypothetical protein
MTASSSGQSVSLRVSRGFEEMPGFSATVQTLAGSRCRQRRAQPSNVAPSSGGVSVGLYSSTAVLPDAVRDMAMLAAREVGCLGAAISVAL